LILSETGCNFDKIIEKLKMKINWIRKLLRGLSLTTAMFVFQACYGPPQDFGADVYVRGLVKSKKTGEPIQGIKVSVADNPQYVYTNNDGSFSFYTETADSCKIMFEDIDSNQNGAFNNKDTILTNISDEVYLNILLEDK
jgi:putative lipoprotein (rSAM/lipoprotein system)